MIANNVEKVITSAEWCEPGAIRAAHALLKPNHNNAIFQSQKVVSDKIIATFLAGGPLHLSCYLLCFHVLTSFYLQKINVLSLNQYLCITNPKHIIKY